MAATRLAWPPPNFPVGPEGLYGDGAFSYLEAGACTFERFSVMAVEGAGIDPWIGSGPNPILLNRRAL